LEKDQENAQAADQRINKLLLLGAGESGKSTLFKQMITIYGPGFPENERKQYTTVIYNNCITSMQALIDHAVGQVSCPDSLAAVKALLEEDFINHSNVHQFLNLWNDTAIQTAYANRSSFQLYDSTGYFFERLKEIARDDYIPSEQDVLRCRVRTTGIVENTFEIEGNHFKMFDVGGQRNERKKWIHCFENVTAVLFVGVLSEYDLMLFEDETMNRMEETLVIFDEICNSRWFRETSIILFLNKRDLFEEKIKRVPLTVCPVFKDYTGPSNYEAGCRLIEQSFQDKNRDQDKQIYVHITCATDKTNVTAVFEAVKDIVIRNSLRGAGLV